MLISEQTDNVIYNDTLSVQTDAIILCYLFLTIDSYGSHLSFSGTVTVYTNPEESMHYIHSHPDSPEHQESCGMYVNFNSRRTLSNWGKSLKSLKIMGSLCYGLGVISFTYMYIYIYM